jgi:hypothetical protein
MIFLCADLPNSSFSRVAWSILDCAQYSHPPNPERAETRSCPRRAHSSINQWPFQARLSFSLGRTPMLVYERPSNEAQPILYPVILRERPRLPFTARIGRAHSYRARSASKKGTWPLPAHPSQGARSGSQGPTWVSFQSPSFFVLPGWYDARCSET